MGRLSLWVIPGHGGNFGNSARGNVCGRENLSDSIGLKKSSMPGVFQESEGH